MIYRAVMIRLTYRAGFACGMQRRKLLCGGISSTLAICLREERGGWQLCHSRKALWWKVDGSEE
jgi:hypothetical protein